MKIRFILLFTAVFIFFFANAQETADPYSRLSGIDSLLEKVRHDYHAAGFSVAVVYKDSLIYAKGFGYRDYENKLPATENTIYAIGSSSKAFTTALLGLLEKEGKLSFNDKAVKYLPALEFKDGRQQLITIKDMITHRTGYARYDYSWYMFNTTNRDSLLGRVKYMTPNAELRERWQYNNYMYLAQGMIAEKITGKSWEENIKERFFAPLGMSRSSVDISGLKHNKGDVSFPYTVEENKQIKKMDYYDISGIGPAGSINSSVKEMSNWLKVWVNNGVFNGDTILPEGYVKRAASPQMVIEGGFPSADNPDIHITNYGFAWFISSYRGHYLVQHGGNIDGFSANAAFFPSDSLGIVVLSNQNNSRVPGIVRNYLADRFFGLPFVEWNKAQGKVEQDTDTTADTSATEDLGRIRNTSPSHALADYTGFYDSPLYSKFEIVLENDTLKTKLGTRDYWLSHYHYDIFEARLSEDGKADTAAGGIKVSFRTGLDGNIESVVIPFGEGVEPAEFKREAKAVQVDKSELEKYAGTYELSGMRITITVKNDILYMDVPGQRTYETIAQGNHHFRLKGLDGFSIRFEESAGKITALNSIQPNGTFRVPRVN